MIVPHIIWFIIFFTSFVAIVATTKKIQYDAFSSVLASMILSFVYWWGGLFSSFDIFDFVLILVLLFDVGLNIAKDGEWYSINKPVAIISYLAKASLLYLGGFFKPILVWMGYV